MKKHAYQKFINFPQIIEGEGIYLQLPSKDKKYLNERLEVLNKNRDDLYYPGYAPKDIEGLSRDISMHKENIKEWEKNDDAKALGEYGIHLLTEEYIGSIWFIIHSKKLIELMTFVDKDYRRQNISSQSIQLLEKLATDIGFKQVMLRVEDYNEIYCKVAEKNNYIRNPKSTHNYSTVLYLYEKALTK